MEWPIRSPKQQVGFDMEKLACVYLEKQGLQCIEKNYRMRGGELDLVMRDKTTIVFVEVRYRHSQRFGGAIESIDWFKQQRIITAAKTYVMKYNIAEKFRFRFDVILMSGDKLSPHIQWIQDAFEGA